MSGLFHLERLLYCLSFKDERATIQGQLLKVFLPMIGVSDGGMCGRHSHSTSPRSSAHIRNRHRAYSFRRWSNMSSATVILLTDGEWVYVPVPPGKVSVDAIGCIINGY